MRVLRPVTHVNVDDLERALAADAQLAPAFVEQAMLWLAPSSARVLEPGVRERLLHLMSPATRTQRLLGRLAGP
jgi:hypothetical protein